MSAFPSFEQFHGQIGQAFVVTMPDYRETLTLVSATMSKHAAPTGMPRGFSLILEGEDKATMLAQHIYPLNNAGLGRLTLFLACIGRLDDGRFRYEVVIN